MKRFASLLIIAALLLCTGCGAAAPAPAAEVTPEPVQTAESVLEMPEIPVQTAVSEEEQRAFIESRYDEWKQQDETYGWAYLICDMDHNGRLEVISASLQGTGLYTYADYYEVNADCTQLVKLPTDAAEGESWPDIMKDGGVTCYHDLATGKYWYVYDDIIRASAWESWDLKEAVCLFDGSVSHVVIAKSHTVCDENGGEVTEYTDRNGVAISAEDFEESPASFFADLRPEGFVAEWVRVGEELLREPMLAYASDLFDGYGYTHYQCDKTGVYDFAAVNSDGITWEVYLLDAEFNDAERFIPQVYPCALQGDGSLAVNEGQWIYVYCPCNSWTMMEAPEGCAYSWNLNPNK